MRPPPSNPPTQVSKLERSFDGYEAVWERGFPSASLQTVALAHSPQYIEFLQGLARDATPSTPLAVTPALQNRLVKLPLQEVKDAEASDTFFAVGSLDAALRAVGGVVHAVDRVAAGEHRAAFVLCRPPGHHAGVSGCTADACSCGFCLLNNVAVGAVHACVSPAIDCRRVAIVDFDIHHGNGTEEIVVRFNRAMKRKHRPHRIFFASVHLFDSGEDTSLEFYPGTGERDRPADFVLNVPLTPLWVHEQDGDAADDGGPCSCCARRALLTAEEGAEAGAEAVALRGRHEFRHALEQRVVPALHAFQPDLILVSAGFDGGEGDVGNQREDDDGRTHRGFDLQPQDFAFLTERLLEVAEANRCGVVSALEGGYGRLRHKQRVLDRFIVNAAAHAQALVYRGADALR